MAHDVFISHSAKDKAVADAACARLEQAGYRCWIAPRDVSGEWAKAIVEAIRGARVFVLIFSREANLSPQVNREVERAVSKGLPIVPLRIEEVTPSDALEYFISNQHWLDALTPPLERHLDRLANTVGMLLSAPPVAPLQRPSQPAMPPAVKPGPNWPLWISLVLVMGTLAGGAAYWLNSSSATGNAISNSQEANLTSSNIQLSQPVPEQSPESPSPLVDVTTIDLGPEGRRDATYFLQSGPTPVSNVALTPSSARLVFLYRSRFYPPDALLGGSAPILALEHQGGGTSTVELRFMEPVAAVRLRHAGRQITGPYFQGGAIQYPSIGIFAFDRQGRQIDADSIPAWQSNASSPPPDGWIELSGASPGGIKVIRIVIDGIIDYQLPPAGYAGRPDEPPPPAPFKTAFALHGLEVRRMPESQ